MRNCSTNQDTFMNLRYTTRDFKSGYRYSYSPCRSFSLGPAEISDCYGDVAVRDQFTINGFS